MDLRPYIDDIHRQLAVAAEAGGEDARALADRLAAPLDAAIRLALQDALAAAAEEITVELAPGSVELRLRGREPEFVVTPVPASAPGNHPDAPEPGDDDARGNGAPGAGATPEGEHAPVPGEEDDGAIWRINLRLPLHMKARIERAASHAGVSLNSWLQRAASAALAPPEPTRRDRHAWKGGERYTGWVR